MQAQCPSCSTRIQIDDAKVPEKPFAVRCPKCQAVLHFPGRGAPAPSPSPAPAPAFDDTDWSPAEGSEPARGVPEPSAPPSGSAPAPSPAAIARRERAASGTNDALVALPEPVASLVGQALARLGFTVDAVDDVEEGARLLEQGLYEVAATTRGIAEAGRPETLAQRVLRLPSYVRRRVFVIFVGEEFRTAEGTQAWAAQADFVLHPKDAANADHLIRGAINERRRLYQPFDEARRRIESD